MKKLPKCLYGHSCYSVCVNPNCQMPAFLCQTGSKHLQQCGSFHQKCQRIVWSDIEKVINRNPRKKLQQFLDLEERFDHLFMTILKVIQDEHSKFKTWITTYGHSIEIMKFIKNINDENYKFIDGKFMDMIMSDLFGGQRSLIEAPKIRDLQLNSYFEKTKKQIQSISNIYLKLPTQQDQISHSSSSGHSRSNTKSIKDLKNLQKSRTFVCHSQIVKDLSVLNQFFDDKVKNFKLLFRGSDFYFSVDQFHNRCDNIPHTLILTLNQCGKVLGGYTPLTWSKQTKNWTPDKQQKTFIFSLDLKEKFKLNLPQFAIANNPDRGPIFGCCDLFISDNADKQKSGSQFPISFNNGKYNRRPETTELLTGTRNGKFLLKQWEVFQVQFFS